MADTNKILMPAERKPLTVQGLRELLHYDPATGDFTWRVNVKRSRAGTRAGSVSPGRDGKPSYLLIKCAGKHGKRHRAHRLAWLYMTGEWPTTDIDHRDGNGLNNSWGNLRPAEKSQNNANARLRSNNSVGFKGVTFCRWSNRYRAQIKFRGKSHNLGRYETPEDAHAAYMTAARKIFGEFARPS